MNINKIAIEIAILFEVYMCINLLFDSYNTLKLKIKY